MDMYYPKYGIKGGDMNVEFRKYMHVERLGTVEVEGILLGNTYVFPKIDGTNGSLWRDNTGALCAGSRNRKLSLDNDNQGFFQYVVQNLRFSEYLEAHPMHRLYGEWLIPHTLKTYREDTWRKFYIFDVALVKEDGEEEYLPYDIYKLLLEAYALDYIPAMCVIENGASDQMYSQLDKNLFLIKDGDGLGEGIVLKNYDFYNKFGRQTWAKLVRSEFKDDNRREFGPAVMKGRKQVEIDIVKVFCTEAVIEKAYANIVSSEGGWRSVYIPRLLQTVYYDVVREDIWAMVKRFKHPTIDFRLLQTHVFNRVKEYKKELFS